MNNFSKLPVKKQHAWLYMSLFMLMGFVMWPMKLTDEVMQSLLAGICFGAAAMILLFMLGKKDAGEVE